MTGTVAAVRGLESAGADATRKLLEICKRNGWDADGLAAAIALESGWSPTALNSAGYVGLLQFSPMTLRAWGLSPDTVRGWSAPRQLELVERYYRAWERRGYRIGPRDFTAFALGVGNVKPRPELLPDDAIMYAPGSPGAVANPALTDDSGAITVATARAALNRVLAAAGGKRFAPGPKAPPVPAG